MAIIKKTELKQLNKQVAGEKLNDLRKELMKANSQIAMGTLPENPGRIREIKRTITKLQILIKQKNKQEVSKKHE
ncbi:MAG: 50S ribosomal protein L29 [Nanoarchaeota archaeon]|nr:50S ribosomal protein L29 [Nanoarchaeota archaeon]MBU1445015.1 50S ribosomal protein L29 [Nanoarchaeota archaeon]MBU2420025.1 50S ribosomal protein L29 [Nanoarchaeota archaeon]MBU2475495.1 50S ribosomal protein L29 [Nanoarchaeota archaeon]MBU3940540.1 50S ribosomal protein L29 [Nanoarchaeota archaeon]